MTPNDSATVVETVDSSSIAAVAAGQVSGLSDPEGLGVWIGPADRPLAARMWAPQGTWSGAGVVMLPAVGYDFWTSFQTIRALAMELAKAGVLVLRIDYYCSGDSAGDQREAGQWAGWLDSIEQGVSQLRAWGAKRIGLAGLRVGATLALNCAQTNGVDAVAALLPVTAGRRFTRELALMSGDYELPDHVPAGTISQAGVVFPPDLVTALKTVDLRKLQGAPPEVLLVDWEGRSPDQALETHLRELGSTVDHEFVEGFEVALERPTEEADVAANAVDVTAGWLTRTLSTGESIQFAPAALRDSAAIAWADQSVQERFSRIGRYRLACVETAALGDRRATVVLLNTGSEVHLGPGRAWVEFARDLARSGYEVVRPDFRGWGDSPDDGFSPGRPFDEHGIDDAVEIVDALRARGREKIVLMGLCSGAWIAQEVSTRVKLEGAIVMNAQLYWQPGEPMEALVKDTRRRRAQEVALYKAHGAELEQSEPHYTADLLARLEQSAVPQLMLFADDDDGLEFLRDRLPKAWSGALGSGVFDLVEIVSLDHSMHMYWRRPEVLQAMLDFLSARVG